ncbi:hypothetical protein Patl1_21349 [Pistacia atlantica]|uniref:Uncharacterized protein n=1 Tax=Pistacia atlantica TaxID=434234 RepID=A0ACC1BKW6_9ROSI|nr:hypothetical protein Patl1_21349 [Pistacia atlantica]
MEKISSGKLGDGGQSSSKRPKRSTSANEQTNEPQGHEERDDICCARSVAQQVGAGRSTNGPVSWIVSDPELLDCPICFEPLTSPVFQCEDGHIVCSLCCTRLGRCSTCLLPVGNIRCRAIEIVLESVKARCPNTKYGCNETMSYSLQKVHEQTCQHVPCSCPFSHCNFISTSTKLYQHFSEKHQNSAVHFMYNRVLNIVLNVDNKFIVLQEEKYGDLFILKNMIERRGNVISVTYIAPPARKESLVYDLMARSGGITRRFQSLAKTIQKRDDNIPALEESLLVPADMFGYYGQLKLQIRISKSRN